jgi:hypothetical protein
VYDLIGGRATWTALGLPTEGGVADRRRLSNFVSEAPSISMRATIADVRALSPRYPVAVVASNGIVVGSLEETAARLPADTPVARAMVPAPGTIRSEMRVEDALRQLREDNLDHVFVTTVSGALMGRVFTDELHV